MCEIKIDLPERVAPTKKSVRLILRTLLHTFCCGLHFFIIAFGLYLYLSASEDIRKDAFLSFLLNLAPCFLTNWNYAFQTIFLSQSLLYDLLEWLDKHHTEFGKKLKYYRDVTFSGLVVPFTLFISSMFWSLYTIDRELVFPEVYDKIVPWWFNHCVHTNITIVVIVETILQARRYPTDKKVELSAVAAIGILYAIVYYTIYFFTGRWLYGVFGIMTWWQVCFYQMLIWSSTFVFYYIQFPINRLFHKEESTEEEKCAEENTQKNGTLPNQAWSLKYRNMRKEVENSDL